jgi:hypothetical protein
VPSRGDTEPNNPRQGRLARLRALVMRMNESTPAKLLALVLLIAGSVTLVLSGYDKFFGGFSCPSKPATYRGAPALDPTVTRQQVYAVLDLYEQGYSQHDANALKDLLDPHACRYPARGEKPQTRDEAIDVYQAQFDQQEHNKESPHPTVNYSLDPRRAVPGAGGRDSAAAFARYHVSAGKDRDMGAGMIDFHLTRRKSALLIDQIVVH